MFATGCIDQLAKTSVQTILNSNSVEETSKIDRVYVTHFDRTDVKILELIGTIDRLKYFGK
jgi:hypothetical protein